MHQLDLFAAPPPPLPAQRLDYCHGCEAEGCQLVHDDDGRPLCFDCAASMWDRCADCGRPEHKHNRPPRWITPDARAICYDCKAARDLNRPAADLRDDEAEQAARLLLDRLPWHDDSHRHRLINRLRELRENTAKQNASAVSGTKKKPPPAPLITVDQVQQLHPLLRGRDIRELAAEAWPHIVALDAAIRAGEDTTAASAALWALELEANSGTSFGILVGNGPKRLNTLLRQRVRAEGKGPRWGVPAVIRFHHRGMHLIAEFAAGGLSSISIDKTRHVPGDLCHSPTGYRSFGYARSREEIAPTGAGPEDYARATLDAYIDGPTKHGMGKGGQLERWIPWEVSEWARNERDRRKHEAEGKTASHRAECPAMMPAEERPAYWQEQDAKHAAQLAHLQAEGMDPFALFPDLAAPTQGALL